MRNVYIIPKQIQRFYAALGEPDKRAIEGVFFAVDMRHVEIQLDDHADCWEWRKNEKSADSVHFPCHWELVAIADTIKE